MLAPLDALGWNGLRPLPTDVYSNLVRFFYCNLEVENLDNIEYTIDTRVRGKTIVLNPTILSEIIGITNVGDCIFINKPSKLDKYVERKRMNEVISINGALEATQTKELKREFRLFNRGISVDSFKKEEEEKNSHHAMEIEGQFVNEELPQQTEEIPEEPSAQIHQLQEGQSMQEEHPPQEGSSLQEGPPTWVLELKATME
ncbi:hypothetical protein Acr_07g0011390 [Actinidia rufa]|uniref:Uncharacterized protein n=1 Tax=Actinidia rufa TaxID=165716 RepID=A0A7J0EX25_9ERIC|nr:hypothetical protein Acr_07g0011390 [Actinidia rufa]